MCTILRYPSREDRAVIQVAVSIFLKTRNGKSRQVMSGVLRKMLDKYKVRRLAMGEYVVVTRGEKQAGVEASNWIEREDQICPGCGGPIYGPDARVAILSIDERDPEYHGVSYGCYCGCVFRKWECAE